MISKHPEPKETVYHLLILENSSSHGNSLQKRCEQAYKLSNK